MERIEGLEKYIQMLGFKEHLCIPMESEIVLHYLAQGEYNINYWFVHPITNEKLVLRINTGSQMHLNNQIEYEAQALCYLKESKRTPILKYCDGSKKFLPFGILVMSFLEGKSLDYKTDLLLAAHCLADIHSMEVPGTHQLLSPIHPLQAILNECNEMFHAYEISTQGAVYQKRKIRDLLDQGQCIINHMDDYKGRRCCINTELNSGNFLINGVGKANYLVDWEKPLYGDPAQDLGHFLAPTTTFWKTDTILSNHEVHNFYQDYIRSVNDRFDIADLEERTKVFIPITCLRGITWCAMAFIEYQNQEKIVKNAYTYKKIQTYLSKEFLDMIETQYIT
ncbi:MAG: aminoglycoside phosphotransferase family protein, partial [Lachnospiraceae bacterium]